MTRRFLLACVVGVTQLLSGCETDAEVRPSTYDELALATGHWEWDVASYMSGNKTPATLGFTRQLTFGAGGNLTIRRNGRADYRTTYQLSMGTTKFCNTGQQFPLITYSSDPAVDNNDVKLYNVSQRNGQQLLTITGEAACVDGGAYETYHWVAE